VLFISHKYWLIDSHGVLHGDVDVLVAEDIPHPARIGLDCQLAAVEEQVSWQGLGPHENYPDRRLAARQGALDITAGGAAYAVYFPYGKRSAR
jgi:beta-galactosidase